MNEGDKVEASNGFINETLVGSSSRSQQDRLIVCTIVCGADAKCVLLLLLVFRRLFQ
jgi:hypothetical protein